MASTYSALKIELIGSGEQQGSWGDTTNTNLGTALEEAIVGMGNPNFTSDANLTLTLTDSNVTQIARHFVLNVTSSVSLTATRDLVVPSIEKPYIVKNATTGARSIVVKTAAGTGVTVPNGKTAYVYTNGVNVVEAFGYFSGAVDIAGNSTVGGTLGVTGATTVGGNLGVTGNTTVTGTLGVTGALSGSTATFTGDGTFSGTGQVKMPAGTTAQRSGSPAAGMLRFNSTLGSFEGYDGASWGGIGGAQAGGAIVTNKSTASSSYTIASGENGFSVGPITVASGVTITVSSGQRWVVI